MVGPEAIRLKVPETLFGAGALAHIGDLVSRLQGSKVLIVTDEGVVRAGILDRVLQAMASAGHTPDVFSRAGVEAPLSVVDEVVAAIGQGGYDLLVGVGGGSSMDTTKLAAILAADPSVTAEDLIAMKQPARTMKRVLVPTTAGTGSEWSASAVLTDDLAGGRTVAFVSELNYPDAVIVDPELSRELPGRPTAHTGMDALAHAIEAFTSCRANVVSDMFASYAIRLIGRSLRPAFAKGTERLEDRSRMAFAASCAMMAASLSGVGLAHFMNHALAKKAALSHGSAVALMLPYVMEYNLVACPDRFAEVAEMLGENTDGLPLMDAAQRAAVGVRRLLRDLRMPQTLAEVGIAEGDVPSLVDELMAYQAPVIALMNPRAVQAEDASFIYRSAL